MFTLFPEMVWASIVVALLAVIVFLVMDRDRHKKLGIHDDLTGLLNQRGFSEFAEQQLQMVKRNNGYTLSLIFIDLNKFKPVNDTYGHLVGDEFLQKFAELLKGALRGADIVGRWGGDEFVVMLPRANRAVAETVIKMLRVRMNTTLFTIAGHPLEVSASIGVSEATKKTTNAKKLIAEADKSMYKEKERYKTGDRCKA